MATREVYKIDQKTGKRSYAGYARFDNDGKFLGTRGGYGPQGRGINADKTGNNERNNASMMQNAIGSAGARTDARRRRMGL